MPAVLIVGAGPTGLTLACTLARQGVTVRVIEKSPGFHRISRGKALNPRSLEVLADLGLGERLTAAGRTGLVFRKYFAGEHVSDTDPLAEPPDGPESRYAGPLSIPQWRTEDLLRERLAEYGVQVELGTELVGFTQDEQGVRAELADGRRIPADYLVGCDGARSPVRRRLQVAFEGRTDEQQTMFCGDVEVDGELDPTVWHQWFGPDGAVLLCPFEGSSVWQFQATPETGPDGRPLEPSLEGFQRIFDRHARMPGVRLRNATWLSVWRANVRMAEHFRVGRVFLAGDAAHVHPFAGGLGMNTGIQDAWNLGWKLAHVLTGQAGDALLDTYQEERLPVAALALDLSTGAHAKVMEAVRVPGVGVEAVATPDLRGLAVHYRWSSLAGSATAGSGGADERPRPGDRAPDAACPGPDGAPARLHEHFGGGRFTLLGFGAAALPALAAAAERRPGLRTLALDAGPGTPADPQGRIRHAYGITGDDLVLVRPDHHLALLAPAAEGRRVDDYLAALGR
ncbi:FAD-dependent monooxygenase [Kitasatospora sp. NPDC057015]|uniref:FAD-dependent monooxygenase n=1 Tax=Kitasatospora sp. NPDC057015 TaxID=3346001 RepID=UPI003638D472